MKIATWNVNSIRARMESFLSWIKEENPDVIMIQELKVIDSMFPFNIFDCLGYNIKVYGQKSWNGVAIFSKYSIEDVVRGLPDYPDQNARFIECLIDGKIRLINVYMPNGEAEDSPKFPYKLEWMHAFTDYIKGFVDSEEPVFIGGDFNVALLDRDIYNPAAYKGSSISAPAAREIMSGWINNQGWTDVFRYKNPDLEKAYTWWGYRGNGLEKDYGILLDYFLANKAALSLVKDCNIDKKPRYHKGASDHAPLIMDIIN